MNPLDLLQNIDMHNPFIHGAMIAVLAISLILYLMNKKPGEAFRFRYIVSAGIAMVAAFLQSGAKINAYNLGDPYIPAFVAGLLAAGGWWVLTRMGSSQVEDKIDKANLPDAVAEIAPEVLDQMSEEALKDVADDIKKATEPDDIAKLLKKLKGIL